MFTEEGNTHIIVIKKLQCKCISSFHEKTNDALHEWLGSKYLPMSGKESVLDLRKVHVQSSESQVFSLHF